MVLGTPDMSFDCVVDCGFEEVEAGSCRRALKVEMNSMDCGDSPRRLVKCSLASCFESVAA